MRIRVPQFVSGRPLWQIDAMGAAVVGLVAGIWYLAGIQPLSAARAARAEMEAALTSQTIEAQNAATLAAKQEASLKTTRAKIEASSIQLHRVDKINARVSELAGAAGGAGLRVDEVKPQQPTTHARFTTVPIRISGGGDYGAIAGFFGDLRASFRDTGVTGFQVRSMEEQAGTTELRFVLDLVWYAAPQVPTEKK